MTTDDVEKKRVVGRPWAPGQSGNPNGRPRRPSIKRVIQEIPVENVQAMVDGLVQVVLKGRTSDKVRAFDVLAKHGADITGFQVQTEDFTITIAPSAALLDAEEDEEEEESVDESRG